MDLKKKKNLKGKDAQKALAEKIIDGLNDFEDLHVGNGSENFNLFIKYASENLDYDRENYVEFYNSLINFTGLEVAYTLLMQRPLFNQKVVTETSGENLFSEENRIDNRYVEFLDGKYEGWSTRVESVTAKLEDIRGSKPVTNHEKYVYMNRALVEDTLWDFNNERYSLFESWRIEDQANVLDYLEYLGYIACVIEEDDLVINESHYNDLNFFYKFLRENTGIDYPLGHISQN